MHTGTPGGGWMRLSVRGREGGGSRHSLEGGGCDLAYVCFVPPNHLGGFTKKNKESRESGFLKSEIGRARRREEDRERAQPGTAEARICHPLLSSQGAMAAAHTSANLAVPIASALSAMQDKLPEDGS